MSKRQNSYLPPKFYTTNSRIEWIRSVVIRLSYEARSAHLGSSLSIVEILDAILEHGSFLEDKNRDRLILSKGHAAMAFYAALVAHGLIESKLLNGYLSNGTSLWGHVTRNEMAPVIDASTGSLGHGLSLACGHSYGDRLRRRQRRVFVVLSDGECDEGSTWEAASFAGHHQLNNIVSIVDYNNLQGFGFCDEVLNKKLLPARWESFGWQTVEVDGHDVQALSRAFEVPKSKEKPRLIIAHTVKGRGIPRIENTLRSHYLPASDVDTS